MNCRKLLIINLLLILVTGIFINSNNSLFLFIKFLYLLILPGGVLLCFIKTERETLLSFVFKAFAVNITCFIFFTVLIKFLYPPLTLGKLYLLVILFSIIPLFFISKIQIKDIFVSKIDMKIFIMSFIFLLLLTSWFRDYLFSDFGDMGSVVYRNNENFTRKDVIRPIYTLGDTWEKKGNIFFLEGGKTGNIYLQSQQKQKEFLKVFLAIKGNVGSNVTLKFNGESIGTFAIVPFEQKGPFYNNFCKLSKQCVIFFEYFLMNEGNVNLLEINPESDIHCSTGDKVFSPSNKFFCMYRLFDLMEITINSEQFLEKNLTTGAQPPLHFYIGSIGFLFWGISYKTLIFIFLAEIFLIFLAFQSLIIQEKSRFFMIFFCLAPLFLYLKDYILTSHFLLNDTVYVLNFLIFLFFLLKRDYFWCGFFLFLMSIVRFPGYLLGASYLFFFALFFVQDSIKERKAINMIFACTFVGVVIVNVVYPALVRGFWNWLNVLYFENIEEHYSKNYIFSLVTFFNFFKKILSYTLYLPLFSIFRKDKLIFFLILGVIPYSIILATIRHPQLHHMFPIVCILLIAGIRGLSFSRLK